MSHSVEVMFISENSDRTQTINCVNPHIGPTLMSYRNGNGVAKETLSLIGDDYLISADISKPILHVWPINSEEPASHLRMVVSGKVTALAVSKDGVYCAAGINCKLYIWNTSSGYLLKVIVRHYQSINKIIFSPDGAFLITAGEDGIIYVWSVSDVVAKETGNVVQTSATAVNPVYTFSQHSLPVSDMHLGFGAFKARLFSVSADQTCKIFSLADGNLLLSLVYDYILTAVVANNIETDLFVGTSCGKIQLFNLDPYPRNQEHHVTDGNLFVGHSKAISALAISIDGLTMASGSEDKKVILWNIPSRQMLRVFEMKGPITGVFFHLAPKNVFENELRPRMALKAFEKASPPERSTIEINVNVHADLEPIETSREFDTVNKETQTGAKDIDFNGENNVAKLKEEICRLREANKTLYQFAMREILKNPMKFNEGHQEVFLNESMEN